MCMHARMRPIACSSVCVFVYAYVCYVCESLLTGVTNRMGSYNTVTLGNAMFASCTVRIVCSTANRYNNVRKRKKKEEKKEKRSGGIQNRLMANIWKQACTDKAARIHVHEHKHTNTHKDIRSHTNRHTLTHTKCTHTHTYTHIHTHTQNAHTRTQCTRTHTPAGT